MDWNISEREMRLFEKETKIFFIISNNSNNNAVANVHC